MIVEESSGDVLEILWRRGIYNWWKVILMRTMFFDGMFFFILFGVLFM